MTSFQKAIMSINNVKIGVLDALERYQNDTYGVDYSEAKRAAVLEKLVLRASEEAEITEQEAVERFRNAKVDVCGRSIDLITYLIWCAYKPDRIRSAESDFDSDDGIDLEEYGLEEQIKIGELVLNTEEYLEWFEKRSDYLKMLERV